MDIVLGDHNRWFMDGNEQIISASHVIPHPNYESWLVNNDIMLIKLSKPATLNQYVQAVALPTSCAPAGTMCTVSGWGVTMDSGGCTLHDFGHSRLNKVALNTIAGCTHCFANTRD